MLIREETMADFLSDFVPVDYEASLNNVEEGQELWLVRMPRKFPVTHMPRKIVFQTTGDKDMVGTCANIKVGEKSYTFKGELPLVFKTFSIVQKLLFDLFVRL